MIIIIIKPIIWFQWNTRQALDLTDPKIQRSGFV